MIPDWGDEIVPKLVLLDLSTPGGSLTTPCEVTFVCDPSFHGTPVWIIAEEASHRSSSQGTRSDTLFHQDPSQRVLALMFPVPGNIFGGMQGICVVHSETLLKLARETDGGVVEWGVWGKYTITPDADDTPGFGGALKYLVSGSRFARVGTIETEKRAEITIYDLSHWTRQRPGTGEPDGKIRYRRIEGAVSLPHASQWNVSYMSMLRDDIVSFRVGTSTFLQLNADVGSRQFTDRDTSAQGQGVVDVLHFG